ncbi:MAG: arginase family protein [Ferruginibacter sp.]
MTDLSQFNPDAVSNPNNNIFGLPFSEDDARLIILPVPWEVTVSRNAGTARAPEHIFRSSLLIELYDPQYTDCWRQGYFMQQPDKKILLKSDYLRKEAELYINYITDGEKLENNKFMCKSLREINEGSLFLNNWVQEQTTALLDKDKLVGLLGGDLSTPFGYYKALAEKHNDFGILHIDSHCGMRKAYEGFTYSHVSLFYNALEQIPQIKKLVQLGIRDFAEEEWNVIRNSGERISTFLDVAIKKRIFEGETWKQITDDIVAQLPEKVIFCVDIDGLDPKLCPHTSTSVAGGFNTEQIHYLFKSVIDSGRQLIGFNLNEVGISHDDWDEKVGARILFELCNFLMASNTN